MSLILQYFNTFEPFLGQFPMVSLKELLLLKRALSRGMISPLEMARYLEHAKRQGAPLSRFLVQHQFLSPSQWKELEEEGPSLPQWPDGVEGLKRQNQQLYQYLKDRGMVSLENLEKGWTLYQTTADSSPLPFWQILVREGVVSQEGLSSLLGIRQRASLICPGCRRTFMVLGFYPWLPYPCLFCQGFLAPLEAQPASEKDRTERIDLGFHKIPSGKPPASAGPDQTEKMDLSLRQTHSKNKNTAHLPQGDRPTGILSSHSQGSPSQSEEKSPLEGEVFGKFKILSRLGEGGMGVVYKAFEPHLKRTVALKLLSIPGGGNQEEYTLRFEKEVQVAAKLKHPHIIPIYEVGEVEGRLFFTMEYIEGTTLRDYVEEKGRLSREEALSIVEKVVGAMVYAHGEKVIHRDLKPENIMMDDQREPHIMDFGLAKEVEMQETRLTRTGSIMGSPEFMAPEQALGEGNVGYSADIYALGGMLYFVLTGRPVFIAEEIMNLLLQVVNNEPISVREFNPAVSRDLEIIIHKCLEKDPSDRYPKMELLHYDVRAVIAEEPILARPPSLPRRMGRWIQKNRVASLLLIFLLLSLMAVVGGKIYLKQREQLARRETEKGLQQKNREEQKLREEQKKKDLQKALVRLDSMLKILPREEDLKEKYPSHQMVDLIGSEQIEREEALRKYLEFRGEIEGLLRDHPENPSLYKRLYQVDREMGLIALGGRNYLLSRICFERCISLGYGEEGKKLLKVTEERKRDREKGDRKKIKALMEEVKEPPQKGMVDEYVTEIVQMKGSHTVEELVGYLSSEYEWQRRIAITVLGKLRDKRTRVKGKDAGEWLAERLLKLDLSFDVTEAEDIIWALGRLRDSRANELIHRVRMKVGENTLFGKRTKTPFQWIPLDEKKQMVTAQDYYGRGILWFGKGDDKRALADLTEAIRRNSSLPLAYLYRGEIYQDQKKYEEAHGDFSKTIDLSPNLFKGYNSRGLVRRHMKNLEGALRDFTRALELKPESALLYNNRGMVYQALGKKEEARSDYRKAISLDSQQVESYRNLGELYYLEKNYSESLEWFNKALSINPDESGYNNRGLVLWHMGKKDLALRDFNRTLRLNPRFGEAYHFRGLIKLDQKKWDDALKDFNRALKLNPKDAESTFCRGLAWQMKKKWNKALDDYNKALELKPYTAKYLARRGEVYAERSEFEPALDDLKQAILLNPKDWHSYVNRSYIYKVLGQLDKGIEDLDKAISLEPKKAEAYKKRGHIYLRKGEKQKALADFEKYLHFAPKAPDAGQVREWIRKNKE